MPIRAFTIPIRVFTMRRSWRSRWSDPRVHDRAKSAVGLKQGALALDPPAGAKHRKTQFKTVADVADFVVKNMPADSPGSLQPEQYWAILAFDLKANGIDLGNKKLDGPLASTLTIPR